MADTQKTFGITGMTCGQCVARIKAALAPFAETVDVTLTPPRAILKNLRTADDAPLRTAVAAAGHYTLTDTVDAATGDTAEKGFFETYRPLLLIVLLISLASFSGAATVHDWMMHFMAGFFIVFAFFKLLNLGGFRDAFATYDLLAARVPVYGTIYPFIELALGFSFLFGVFIVPALWVSIFIMGFGAVGVIRSVLQKRKIRCACLGTVLNLPMSSLTIVENLGMVLMSALMLAP